MSIRETPGLWAALNCVNGAGVTCFAGNQSKIQTGYTVGGGIEYAMWQNDSLKAEYLYVNLGSGNVTAVSLYQTRLNAFLRQ